MSDFRLSKWYLDCVSEDGVAFIGYSADLHWRGVALHYASILVRQIDGNVHAETSFRNVTAPERNHEVTRWNAAPFRMEGEWKGLQNPVSRLLFNDNGRITWSCFSPMARASVNIAGMPPLHGLGYVEHLDLSVAPWRIPIRELRWGRFLTGGDSVVWIDWRGPAEKTLVLINGEAINNATVQDFSINSGGNVKVSLRPAGTIRSGPVVSSTLSRAPGLTRLFPRSVLKMHEEKWISRGELQGLSSGSGWAIHELVSFA